MPLEAGAGAARKQIPGAGVALEKIRSRSRLKKSHEPELLKN